MNPSRYPRDDADGSVDATLVDIPFHAPLSRSRDDAAEAIGALARLYHRHGDPARALALSLAAMRLAPPEPGIVLVAASAFLRTGDAVQALAALSRFERPRPGIDLSRLPSPTERAGCALLLAKARHRTGDVDGAAAALVHAREAAGDPVEERP